MNLRSNEQFSKISDITFNPILTYAWLYYLGHNTQSVYLITFDGIPHSHSVENTVAVENIINWPRWIIKNYLKW